MTHYEQIIRDKVHWRIAPEYRSLIDGQDALPVHRLESGGRFKLVKHGPHRCVYKVHHAGHDYFIKHFRAPDLRALASQFLKRSKGLREWGMLRWAATKDVSSIAAVAVGERRENGLVRDNFLITKALTQVEPLPDFALHELAGLPENVRSKTRKNLAFAAAEVLAKAHDAGLQHRDMHAGNLLVEIDGCDVKAYLIDLDAAQKRRMDWRRSRSDLIALGMGSLKFSSSIDRLRFLKHYLRLRKGVDLDFKTVARSLQCDVLWAAHRSYWRRTFRCLGNNRRFYSRDIGLAHGNGVADLPRECLEALLRDPDAPLREAVDLVKDSRSSKVVDLPIPMHRPFAPPNSLDCASRERGEQHDGRTFPLRVIYKRIDSVNRMDSLRALLHNSPAFRAWIAGYGLLLRGIPTPRPIAVIERTPYGFVRQNYLITEKIENSCSLLVYLTDVLPSLPESVQRSQLRWLATYLGRLLRKLHDWAVSHRDLKAVNILVRATGNPDEPFDVYLIDLEAVHMWRRLPAKRRIQNLSRMLVSVQSVALVGRTNCLRFLRAYLRGGLSNRSWKSHWKKVARRAVEKVAQNQSRGRVIR